MSALPKALPRLPARQRAALAWLQPLPTRRVWRWQAAVRHAGGVVFAAGLVESVVRAYGGPGGLAWLVLMVAGTAGLWATEAVGARPSSDASG